MNQYPGSTPLSAADRKKQLIVEGQMYRFGIAEAREEISTSLQMDTLTRKALRGVASGAASMLAGKLGKGSVSALLPLAVSSIGALVKKIKSGSGDTSSETGASSRKLPVRKLLIAGAIGLAGALVARHKFKQKQEEQPPEE